MYIEFPNYNCILFILDFKLITIINNKRSKTETMRKYESNIKGV